MPRKQIKKYRGKRRYTIPKPLMNHCLLKLTSLSGFSAPSSLPVNGVGYQILLSGANFGDIGDIGSVFDSVRIKAYQVEFHALDNTSARVWHFSMLPFDFSASVSTAVAINTVGEIANMPGAVTAQNGVDSERSKWRKFTMSFSNVTNFIANNVVQINFGFIGESTGLSEGL